MSKSQPNVYEVPNSSSNLNNLDSEPIIIEGLKQEIRPILQARVTVVQQVYYENEDGATQLSTIPYTQLLSSKEEPYCRTIKIDENWTKLELGWLKDMEGTEVSLVCLCNMEGKHSVVMPTDEELKESKERIIDIGIAYPEPLDPNGKLIAPFAYIPPRATLPIPAINIGNYYVRCRKGSTRLKYSIVPK